MWDDKSTLTNNLLSLAASLIGAASYLLSRGRLHMDIKADNVRFSDKGEPVLIDFGSCVEYSPVKDIITFPESLAGNLAHMAPEVHRALRKGTPVSGDKQMSFSIGVLLAECLDPKRDHPYEEYDDGGKVPSREHLGGWREYVLSSYAEECRANGTLAELVEMVHDMIAVDPAERISVMRARDRLDTIRTNCVGPSAPDGGPVASSSPHIERLNPTVIMHSPPAHTQGVRSAQRSLSGQFTSPAPRVAAPKFVSSSPHVQGGLSPRSDVVGHTVPRVQHSPVCTPPILEHKGEIHGLTEATLKSRVQYYKDKVGLQG